MSEFDLVIRGGTVADGRGGALYEADVAIRGDHIVQVGKISGAGAEEIDAKGLLVTPGWVDIHTHYDGQATWDNRLAPSSIHGVTTVVAGNCGVGFAPVRSADHHTLIRLMEGVEDIPGAALHEGLAWDWESFGQYMDAVERLPHDIDVALQVPHGALRVYVMGERGVRGEPATAQDVAEMSWLLQAAIADGALGFSTTRTAFHRTADGHHTPTTFAEDEELVGIVQGLAAADAGVIQWVTDFKDIEREFALLKRLMRVSGRPLSFSMVELDSRPGHWRELMRRLDAAVAEGLPMRAQVQGRAVGIMIGLQSSAHPFIVRPSYLEIADAPVAERARLMRDPERRARILAEPHPGGHPFIDQLRGAYHLMFALGDPPNYEPRSEDSIAARALTQGIDPEALAYDVLAAGDGSAYLYFALANYAQGDLDAVLTMMRGANTVCGLSDGGAHVGAICDGSVPTFMLTHWCRDRTRGERLDLPFVVKAQTRDTAAAVGLLDRGVLARGYKADLNVIDFDRLKLGLPRMTYDLPAGARRLMQDADGYVATISRGQVIYREGQPTRALPGKLVRGAQRAP